MTKFYCFLILFSCVHISMAQTGGNGAMQSIVTGTVTDGRSGSPLPGVTVAATGTGIAATTDISGAYELKIPAGSITLSYTAAGYANQTEVLNIPAEAQTLTVNKTMTTVVTTDTPATPAVAAPAAAAPSAPNTAPPVNSIHFVSTNSSSNSIIVKGTVVDEKDGSAMIGVNVVVKGTTNGVSTDISGNYQLNIPMGTVTLSYTYVGYQERIELVTSTREGMVHTINEKMTDKSKELDIVVVSGNKVEKSLGEQIQSMEVMKGQNVTQSAQGLEEAMNKVPGINMIGKTISIRGSSGFSDQTSNRTLVLMDDVPMLSPENGSVHWNAMPTEAIEQMEITKGSSTVLYGSQALSGSINVRTIVPQKDSVISKFYLNYGDYFRFQDHTWTEFYKKENGVVIPPMYGNLAYVYARKFKDVDVVYDGAYSNNQGYTSYNADELVRNYVKIRYIPHNHPNLSIGGMINFAYEKYDDFFLYKNYNDTFPAHGSYKPTYNTQVLIPSDSNVVKNYNLNINPYINYYDKFGSRHSFKAAYYYVKNDNNSGDSGVYHKLTLDYAYTRRFKNVDADLAAGVRYSYKKIEGLDFGDRYAHYAAAYGQFEKTFAKRFTIKAGLSLEFNKLDTVSTKNDLTFINTLATRDSAHRITAPIKPVVNVGVNYKLTEGTFLRGSFGQGYRFPDIAEEFVLDYRSGAVATPNPNLKPESGWNAEVGLKQGMKFSRWVFYADLAGYISQYTNLIEFTSIQQGAVPQYIQNRFNSLYPIYEQAQNISHAQIAGIEVSAIGTGSIFGVPLNFLLGYNYMDPRNLDYNPNDHGVLDRNHYAYLYYRMKHSAKADIQTTYKNFILGFTAVYIGHVEQIDPLIGGITSISAWYNSHSGSGDVVLDARFGYNFKNRITTSLIAKNITNHAYVLRPGFIEAPASLTLQVTYALGKIIKHS